MIPHRHHLAYSPNRHHYFPAQKIPICAAVLSLRLVPERYCIGIRKHVKQKNGTLIHDSSAAHRFCSSTSASLCWSQSPPGNIAIDDFLRAYHVCLLLVCVMSDRFSVACGRSASLRGSKEMQGMPRQRADGRSTCHLACRPPCRRISFTRFDRGGQNWCSASARI